MGGPDCNPARKLHHLSRLLQSSAALGGAHLHYGTLAALLLDNDGRFYWIITVPSKINDFLFCKTNCMSFCDDTYNAGSELIDEKQ
ncbi:hypothetical protein PGTUg99_035157 [Puccinia graminis f. sp. tritici]|uniref:Uncharacterized protein n=1 Tax=Puccinia graminis f. sp. tritici TaxID=56615 RepID=A0A5B0P4X4_PUCGR|nr:hypothetical protein PGTUg99_035157 [Puccinia graminis f. sp. tritici]